MAACSSAALSTSIAWRRNRGSSLGHHDQKLHGVNNHVFAFGALGADGDRAFPAFLETEDANGPEELGDGRRFAFIDLYHALALGVVYRDWHAIGPADVGIVRHAHLVEAGDGQVGREGGAFLALLFLQEFPYIFQ